MIHLYMGEGKGKTTAAVGLAARAAGSGMKVKTCESLMYGKNIIGTKETFEGYNLDTDKVGGLCNTPKEFIDRINYFIHHPVTRYNPYAREVFLRNNSEESTQSVFCSVF